MVRPFALILLSLLAVCGAPASAASPWQRIADPVFTRTDTRELPEAAVMSLAQDSAGFLWVGTQGGLARYDGYHFRNFLANPTDPAALPDGYVRTLLPDSLAGLWIGSSSDGLVHFDARDETFHTWHPDRLGRRGPRSGSVDALVAEDGHIWVGGDGGLDRFDTQAASFVPATLVEGGVQPTVFSLLVDHRGTLWAGTERGLFYRTARSSPFRTFSLGAHVPIYSLLEDGAGRVWAGSLNALFAIDPAKRQAQTIRTSLQDAHSLAPGQQWTMIEMTPGVVWAGTDTAISIVNATTRSVHRIARDVQYAGGLSGGRLVQFLRDRSGLVWAANHVGGLLEYNPQSRGLYELSSTRSDINLGEKGAVALDAVTGNRLWAGGFTGTILELDTRTARARAVRYPNSAAIQSFYEAPDGTLWIGTTAGLCEMYPHEPHPSCSRNTTQFAGQSIYSILAGDKNTLWLGGTGGLVADDIATGSLTRYPPPGTVRFSNDQVRVLYRDRRRRLWVGTENGLYRIDPGGRVARFVFTPGTPNSIGPGGLASILEDRRGRIWAGKNGGPLDILEEDAAGTVHFRRMGIAQGLPHENVDGLEEDARGRIWASTDRGIALIDPDTLRARALGASDGVSDGAYWAGSVTKAADGTIFFGGIDGIAIVAPDAASPWTDAPPIVVSALQVGRRSVPAWDVNHGDGPIELPADARDINVEFSSLDYSAPQLLRYSYKLDGYDRDWIDTDPGHRVATYTHLSPGNYTLEVRGTNRLGIWSSNVLRLRMHALPAWYETWWFRILVAALLIAGAFATHLGRTAVLRRRGGELEAIVTERTSELSAANTKLQEQSDSDPLTGLRNRRFLTQHLEADVATSLRRYQDRQGDPDVDLPTDADLLFFLVDLDYLKTVNDQFGHNSGDLMLIEMRGRLHEVFRESDFVVRWGGDEFLAVARGSRRSDAPRIAERICEAVANRAFSLGGDATLAGSVSVGFASFPFVPAAPSVVSWLQVVGLADQALYLAKQAGRNTWFGLTTGENTDLEKLIPRLESDAAEAVRHGDLIVVSRDAIRAN